eukprot:TRINITY_DN51522_c0_g1_i1.p1 TRINITY_DN51522_c0_g1~~TRINITY_DN51522_c0_g1_i1.p1  ORF type:complete len:321 (+),score=35.34 TRINITY_DN51522_c0_g1_i1:94-1056(+)
MSAFLLVMLSVAALGWIAKPTAAAKLELTATGCPDTLPTDEFLRAETFRSIHGDWPIKLRYPGGIQKRESKAWEEYMENKLAEVMAFPHSSTSRWEHWLELAQMNLLKTFTHDGWGVSKMPGDLHESVVDSFRKQHTSGRGRDEGDVMLYIEGQRTMIDIGKLLPKVTQAARVLVGEWAGIEPASLIPTSTYGIRVYDRNSTLKTHVDRVETHVLSAVYVVDYQYDSDKPGSSAEPWYLVADPDNQGKRAQVHVKPGEIFFYESAKLPHGRPSVLHGDFSAHIFIHFKPKHWPFHNTDRVYALPTWWNDEHIPSSTKREL